jgi:A/G-specific adenine glycosylase
MLPSTRKKQMYDSGHRNQGTKVAELKLFFDSKRTSPRNNLTAYLRRFFWQYYKQNGRFFPWRQKRTSVFQLLVAETLLKQTKASDVVPVWLDLIHRYPTPASLANARKVTLLRLLEPLGLQNQRMIALTSMAKAIVSAFSGKVPREIDDLLRLPYVGLYSACTITCFHYGNRVPIVDANILRVIGRLMGDDFGRDLRRNHDVWAHAWAILPMKHFAAHNYGLLDFSALVCTARNPACTFCALRRRCVNGQSKLNGVCVNDSRRLMGILMRAL